MGLLSNDLKENGFSSGGGADNILDLKAVDGTKTTRFTILGNESKEGWECWGDGAEPGKRLCIRFAGKPTDSDIEERFEEKGGAVVVGGKNPTVPKRFMAFAVWNYEAERVQLLRFTQSSIAKPLIMYLQEEEVEAEPQTFDFVLSAKMGKEPRDKRFSIACLPGRRRKPDHNARIEEAWEKVQAAGFDLSRVYDGDVFKAA